MKKKINEDFKKMNESIRKRVTVKEIKSWLKHLEEFRYRKIPQVDARRVASFVNNDLSEDELPKSLVKKWEYAKYGREKHLADKYIKEMIREKLTTTQESKIPKLLDLIKNIK